MLKGPQPDGCGPFLRQNKNGKTDKNGRQVLFITTVSTVSVTCSQASMQDSR